MPRCYQDSSLHLPNYLILPNLRWILSLCLIFIILNQTVFCVPLTVHSSSIIVSLHWNTRMILYTCIYFVTFVRVLWKKKYHRRYMRFGRPYLFPTTLISLLLYFSPYSMIHYIYRIFFAYWRSLPCWILTIPFTALVIMSFFIHIEINF